MSTSHHGAGGSYVIDEAGTHKLQHRTKSREEAKSEATPVSASAVQAPDTPAADKAVDQKKLAIRNAGE